MFLYLWAYFFICIFIDLTALDENLKGCETCSHCVLGLFSKSFRLKMSCQAEVFPAATEYNEFCCYVTNPRHDECSQPLKQMYNAFTEYKG